MGLLSFWQRQLRFNSSHDEDDEQHCFGLGCDCCEQQVEGGASEQQENSAAARPAARQQQLEGIAAGNANEQVSSQKRSFTGGVILG